MTYRTVITASVVVEAADKESFDKMLAWVQSRVTSSCDFSTQGFVGITVFNKDGKMVAQKTTGEGTVTVADLAAFKQTA